MLNIAPERELIRLGYKSVRREEKGKKDDDVRVRKKGRGRELETQDRLYPPSSTKRRMPSW